MGLLDDWSDEGLEKAMHRANEEWWRARRVALRRPDEPALKRASDDAHTYWLTLNDEWMRRRREKYGVCAERGCGLPALEGYYCSGHHRMAVGDPGAEFAPNN
jgi:hypothetical protein